ncbi:MAG TPA: ATP synthase F1 subunit delta [Planctomycetaceae bacterium]|jgi:F-type H+-transporting ATPase subunit delta|nr:ATP synthase F1 subunit delta [Planctomycetaceae bacterium]
MADQSPQKSLVTSVMENPSSLAVARTYSDALLNAAGAAGGPGADAVLEELGSFVDDVLAKLPDLKDVFFSRVIGREEKIRLIDQVIAPRGTPIVTSFLRVLVRHDRLELVPLILREARLRQEIRSGKQRVQIKTALPLSDQAKDQLRKRLAESLPFDPILETQVDPSLIGGIVIRVADTVYDSSLATRVAQLRERIRQRSLHEIQSGRDRFSSAEGN